MLRACPACHTQNRIPAKHAHQVGRCGKCKGPLAASDAPLDVDDAGFAAVVAEAQVPVLVDFWASWCGPCLAAAPEVKKAAQALSGKALVLKVDTDAHPRLAAQFGVRGIPHFVVLSHGRPVAEQSGAVNAGALVGYVERALRT